MLVFLLKDNRCILMSHKIPLLSIEEEQHLFGPHDKYVKQVARRYGVKLSSRGGALRLKGPEEGVGMMSARIMQILDLINLNLMKLNLFCLTHQ